MNVSTLISVLWPELLLTAAACVLFLLGVSASSAVRRLVPVIAAAVLVGLFFTLYFIADPIYVVYFIAPGLIAAGYMLQHWTSNSIKLRSWKLSNMRNETDVVSSRDVHPCRL